MNFPSLIVSCEHGGNRVPPAYRELFQRRQGLLKTHRGFDPGALWLAKRLARSFHAPLHVATTTRLLVDLNRSVGHPDLFAPWVKALDRGNLDDILRCYYHPYRRRVERQVAAVVADHGAVFHLSVHTFTPVRRGTRRRAHIGLLYDPGRRAEQGLALRWQDKLCQAFPGWRIRRNYPYRGVADGFMPYLRRRFPAGQYVGIELEVNQVVARCRGRAGEHLANQVAASLQAAWAGC